MRFASRLELFLTTILQKICSDVEFICAFDHSHFFKLQHVVLFDKITTIKIFELGKTKTDEGFKARK